MPKRKQTLPVIAILIALIAAILIALPPTSSTSQSFYVVPPTPSGEALTVQMRWSDKTPNEEQASEMSATSDGGLWPNGFVVTEATQ